MEYQSLKLENSSKKTLFFITAGFPYGKEETFIENEIKYLSKSFDKIIIISHNLDSHEQRKTDHNIDVIRLPYNIGRFGKVVSIIGIFNKYFWKEIKTIKKEYYKNISIGIIKTMLISLYNAKRLNTQYTKITSKHSNSNTENYCYSYWCNDSALALTYMKLKNPTFKTFCRMHGWDVYFEASPIPEEQRKMGFGGINRYKELEGYDNSNLIINTTKRLEILTKQVVVQSRSLEEIESLAKRKEELLGAMPSIQPIHKSDLKRMASGFGYRTDPFTKKRRFHQGMDVTAPRGTPVYASGDGIVGRADNRAAGYGKHIRIDHGFGYISLYAHLNEYKVRRRQKVKRGDVIGYVGSTGRSVGPHLHYEIFKDGKRVNPLNYYSGNLTAEEFDIMLNLANQENQSMD